MYGYQPPIDGPAIGAESSWFELSSVTAAQPNIVPPAVTVVRFDTSQELTWAGFQDGRVHSYLHPTADKYSSFTAHTSEVADILVEHHGLITLSHDNLRYYTRGGLLQLSYGHDTFQHMRCMEYLDEQKGHVLVGGDQPSLLVFDVDSSRVLKSVKLDEGTSIVRKAHNLVACGGVRGQVSLRDPRSFRIEHSFQTHPEGVTSMDLKDYLMITCGLSSRMGRLVVDPMVKVFDIRSMRAMAPIAFPMGAFQAKFLPKFSSTACIVSQTGTFQMTDVKGSSSQIEFHQLNTAGDPITAMDISSSGELVGFGDTGAFTHQWANRDDPHLNFRSHPVAYASAPDPPSFLISKDTPLNMLPMPDRLSDDEDEDDLLSDWPEDFIYPMHIKSVPIPPEVTKSIKTRDFMEYAPKPREMLRNQVQGELPALVPRYLGGFRGQQKQRSTLPSTPSSSSGRAAPRSSPGGVSLSLSSGGLASPSPRSQGHPKFQRPFRKYRRMIITSHRFGVEEFKFSQFNKTKFGVLENILPNTYCNPSIQLLYFIPQVQRYCLNHLDDKEFSFVDELGFIFNMLRTSNGRNCHTSNLLRALGQSEKARSLGLVESEEEYYSADPRPQDLQERLFAFLLQTLQNECKENTTSFTHNSAIRSETALQNEQSMDNPLGVPLIDQLFGFTMLEHDRCSVCQQPNTQETNALYVQLVYPSPEQYLFSKPTFAEVLSHSLHNDDLLGDCVHCGTTKATARTQTMKSLPGVLCIMANLTEETERFWRPEKGTRDFSSSNWLPHKLKIRLDEHGVNIQEYSDYLANGATVPSDDTFELTGVVSHILDPGDRYNKGGHWVAHIKIDPTLHGDHKDPSMKPGWYLFNDISCSSAQSDEPIRFDSQWRRPSILIFSQKKLLHPSQVMHPLNPITSDLFYIPNPFGKPLPPLSTEPESLLEVEFKSPSASASASPSPATFDEVSAATTTAASAPESPGIVSSEGGAEKIPDGDDTSSSSAEKKNKSGFSFKMLPPSQLPKDGDLVAIDAEFVALSAQERVGEKGAIVRPGQFGLARVSVLRQEDLRDLPFIDDYISTPEPIYDYLTRFSGIQEGDLDPSTSPHHVTTLKHVYCKLRYLLDQGCIFVGHGLKKDFRILNLIVPPSQVIDTVDLFNLRHQRKLSLRFLAFFLLGVNIQQQTHCSIEDAKTALAVYSVYCKLVQENRFETVLQEIYHYGRTSQWQVAQQRTGPSTISMDTSAIVRPHSQLDDAADPDSTSLVLSSSVGELDSDHCDPNEDDLSDEESLEPLLS